jgi:hypothetical protein
VVRTLLEGVHLTLGAQMVDEHKAAIRERATDAFRYRELTRPFPDCCFAFKMTELIRSDDA